MSASVDLSDKIVNLSLDEVDEKQGLVWPRHTHTASISSSPSVPLSLAHQQRHSRAQSQASTSSALYSDGSAPNRPPRSPMRRSRDGSMSSLYVDVDSLESSIAALLDKIYEIEELRHQPSARSAHAAQLDNLVSDLHASIQSLAPRMAVYDGNPDAMDLLGHVREDWNKVLAQHSLLKQELLEDPWLIRFRTTADQAEGMMDPLQTSLQDLGMYVGRMLSTYSSLPNEAEGKLSLERLRDMVGAHRRIRATYVPSVNKILRMMERSVSDRAVKNGEALRRLSDMTQRWQNLQKGLGQLDARVALVFSQNDPDHQAYTGAVESLEDDKSPFVSPHQTPPLLHLENGSHYNLQRVTSSGSPGSSPRTSMHGLAPPSVPRTGSATPQATRTLRKVVSRSSLPAPTPYTPAQLISNHYSNPQPSVDRPRWTNSSRSSPPSTPAPRRPSLGGSHSGIPTPTIRRPASPTHSHPSPPGSVSSRMQQGPRKSFSTPQNPAYSGGRPSFGSSLGRPPPSSFRAHTPSSTPARPSSRASVGSMDAHRLATIAARPFQPSKYDLLDLEVQKVIDAVQPNILIFRLDAPLRRGQRKLDGEQWTGEFRFGAGEKPQPVKLLELSGRGMGVATKRVKVMVRVGGAWQELADFLKRKKEDTDEVESII